MRTPGIDRCKLISNKKPWVAFPPFAEPEGILFSLRIKLVTLYYVVSVGVIRVENLLFDFIISFCVYKESFSVYNIWDQIPALSLIGQVP